MWKSLEQIGEDYAKAAAPLRRKLAQLRQEIEQETDPEKRNAKKYEAAKLGRILHELILYERWCKGYYTENRKYYELGKTVQHDRRRNSGQAYYTSALEKRTAEHLEKHN